MNVLPVITRELRAQSRQRFTYFLRAIGAFALFLVGFIFICGAGPSGDGLRLFTWLHFTLFCAIWILVPIAASDCISRERREGTLGLLFLTPLRPRHIVMAKSIAHGLRAATLLVAVIPVLTIPFLMGGVTWEFALLSALLHFSSICWTLAATLTASAISKSAWRALVVAILLTTGALFIASFSIGLLAMHLLSSVGRLGSEIPTNLDIAKHGFLFFSMQENIWSDLFNVGIQPSQCLIDTAKVVGVSCLALLVSILVAAWRMSRNWRDNPPPVWMQKTQRVFLTPVILRKFLSRWLRWQLNRNPLGWLERRHWLSRLIAGSWFAISALVSSLALVEGDFFNDGGFLMVVGWLMMGSLAVCVAGSFRRERETGALELLLVTPLTVRQIIMGRLRGVWGQFLPAVGLFLGIWAYFGSMLEESHAWLNVIYFGGMFVTLPVIGLYFSVRCRTLLGAFLLTGIFSGLVPHFLGLFGVLFIAMFFNLLSELNPAWLYFGALPFQVLFAFWFGWLLSGRLAGRNFPTERTVT